MHDLAGDERGMGFRKPVTTVDVEESIVGNDELCRALRGCCAERKIAAAPDVCRRDPGAPRGAAVAQRGSIPIHRAGKGRRVSEAFGIPLGVAPRKP